MLPAVLSLACLLGIAALLAAIRHRGCGHFLRTLPTLAYLATTAFVAQSFGAMYLLFPELAALVYDVFKRPGGAWARAPLMLVLTPSLAALIGTVVTRHLEYGVPALMLAIGGGMAVVRLLGSPIVPALSAGALPLILGVSSWWYPPAVLLNTSILAALSLMQQRLTVAKPAPSVPKAVARPDPRQTRWILPFGLTLLLAFAAVWITGRRLVLFPPLVVIAFEMFAHPDRCVWARRPLSLPFLCGLTAIGGELTRFCFGTGPLATGCSTAIGVGVLSLAKLHVPPALAVGLIPLVVPKLEWLYPVDVALGTSIASGIFLARGPGMPLVRTVCRRLHAAIPFRSS